MEEIDPIQSYTGWLFRTLNDNKKAKLIMAQTKNPSSNNYPELTDKKIEEDNIYLNDFSFEINGMKLVPISYEIHPLRTGDAIWNTEYPIILKYVSNLETYYNIMKRGNIELNGRKFYLGNFHEYAVNLDGSKIVEFNLIEY